MAIQNLLKIKMAKLKGNNRVLLVVMVISNKSQKEIKVYFGPCSGELLKWIS